MIDGRKKFRGTISDVNGDGFVLNTDKAAYGEALAVQLPFADIADAHLVLTDDLIRDALAKDKALRQQLIPDDDLGPDNNSEKADNSGKAQKNLKGGDSRKKSKPEKK